MDKEKFLSWCASKEVPGGVIPVVLKEVLGKKELEDIVDTVVGEDGNFITLMAALGRIKDKEGKPLCNIKPIIEAYRQKAVPQSVAAKPASTSDQPEAEVRKDPPKKSFPGLGGLFSGKSGSASKKSMGMGPKLPSKPGKTNKKMILMAAGVILLLLMGLVGFVAFSSGDNSPSYSPDQETIPQPTEALPLDEEGNPTKWFTVKPEEIDTTEPFLVKPESFVSFINKLPWRWLLWIVFLFLMFPLLAKDRFSSGERTDISTVIFGLLIMLGTILLTEPLSLLVTWISHQIGSPIEAPGVWINIVGVLVNLGVQWSATTSGKRDYSAFAIAGLFATGAVLIWWNPTVIITVIIGAIFMAGGLALQAHEMTRSRQGGQAVFIAIVMLVVFAITMVIWQVFCWGVSFIPQPDNEAAAKVLGFLAWFLVSSKTWMSGIIAILVVLGAGDMIATAIMPPRRPTSRQADAYPDQNDREKRQEIDSRYDAMVFGIMLLYPIAVVVWEAIRVFGLI